MFRIGLRRRDRNEVTRQNKIHTNTLHIYTNIYEYNIGDELSLKNGKRQRKRSSTSEKRD